MYRENDHCMIIFTREERLNDDSKWVDARRTLGIGASESPSVLGVGRTSAFDIYARKIGALPDIDDTQQLRLGRRLHPIAIEEYAHETKRNVAVFEHTLQSKRWPFMIATPDARQWLTENGSEIECSVQAKITGLTANWRDEIPHDVFVQCQHELAVTGWQQATAVALLGGTSIGWADIERNDEFIEGTLVPACERLWSDVQQQQFTGNIDGSEATKKALAKVYPLDTGATVTLDSFFADLHDERVNRKEVIRENEERLRAIDNQIKAKIESATFGVLSNGVTYSLKRQSRAVLADGVKLVDLPAKYVSETAYRVLRFKEPKKGARHA